MAATVSEYYIHEIADWRALIGFYLEEIEEAEVLLEEVLELNTVPNLAETTEIHLRTLTAARESLLLRKRQIDQLEPSLYEKDIPVDNDHLQPALVDRMKALRKELFSSEREYLEKKYLCDDFLADTIVIQNRIGGNKKPDA
ncbi:hypothetical protein [Flaviaesturariibacter terrae]